MSVIKHVSVAVLSALMITCGNAAALKPSPQVGVKVDGFWRDRYRLLTVKWLPHCIREMEKGGRGEELLNLVATGEKLAGKPPSVKFKGCPWSDAYPYNTVEAACLALEIDPGDDAEWKAAQDHLRAKIDEWIPIFLAAQRPSGYIHSYHDLNDAPHFSHVGAHEFYVMGYFIEMGIAHRRMTKGGDLRLWNAAIRLADHLDATFGPPPKRTWANGHPGMEYALLRLADAVDEYDGAGKGERYARLAQWFVNHQYCGDDSHANHGFSPSGNAYDQMDKPAWEMTDASGHAVRATYFYAAMTGIGDRLGDEPLAKAAEKLFDSAINRKMYLTGGVGSTGNGEAFGPDYDLSQNGYCESCASCGMSFWCMERHRAYGDAWSEDVRERLMYNNLLGSISADGENFYYQNPLDQSNRRYPWHGCPCCVGNIPRTLLALKDTLFAVSADGKTLDVDHFMSIEGASVNIGGTAVKAAMQTGYPNDGKVTLVLSSDKPVSFDVAVRFPNRAESSLYRVTPEVEYGYRKVGRFTGGTQTFSWELPMPEQKVVAIDKVKACQGKVAWQRGPIVYAWEGPNGLRKVPVADRLNTEDSGMARVWIEERVAPASPSGQKGKDLDTFTSWSKYSPTISYDFNAENRIEMPTKDLPLAKDKYARVYSDRWWSFFVGTNANELVKDNEVAAREMLKRFNTDFDYITDNMGWPRDGSPQKGYRSAIFLFGSGLPTDNAPNDAKGGWQSGINIDGTNYNIVLASYYPVYCFDPKCPYGDRVGQCSAMIHEGIHAVFAAMPGCRKAAWFHEGANCWLQAAMERERSHGEEDFDAGDFGWLSTCSIVAPFLPIECYSGWLTDGTFGGPGAQGVCGEAGRGNVRRLFGGVQYSEVFPTFLGYAVDRKAVPWVWMNATGYVLEGIAKGLGQAQTERLILEYRSRLCLCDFSHHSLAVQRMYRNNLGKTLESESWSSTKTSWKVTPYQPTTPDADGWLVPDPITTPGWSGANIIPIKVEEDSLTVSFRPHGSLSSDKNMCCQLCYRTTDGETVYSEPFRTGRFSLDLAKRGKPYRGIVFAVVCNLDYAYTDNEDIRKNHYDYRLKIESRASAADVYADWFDFKVDKPKGGAEPAASASSCCTADAVERTCLDAGWKFLPEGGAERIVDVPHDWSIELPFAENSPNGKAWGYYLSGKAEYRREFVLSESDLAHDLSLVFDGVMRAAKVSVNGGKPIEGSRYGYTGFRIPLAGLVRAGTNEVRVAIDNSVAPASRWYMGSGIYRSVWLEKRGKEYIVPGSLDVRTVEASAASAKVVFSGTMTNTASRSSRKVSFEKVIPSPRLWSPEDPHLYAEKLWGETFRYGVRTVAVDAKRGFLLNGVPVEMHGACVHHDHGPLGAASWPEAERRKALQLKRAGFNAVGTSHNPVSESFIEACDEIGLLVVDEFFDGRQRAKTSGDYCEIFDADWRKDVEWTVRRDRVHPSVVMWSVGNEVLERSDPRAAETTKTMCAFVNALDDTRPITQALCLWGGEKWTDQDAMAAPLDVVGYNYLESLTEGDHDRLPERVILYTETYPKDAEAVWRRIVKHPYVIGEFVWTGVDYLGESGIGRNFYVDREKRGEHWHDIPQFPWHGAYCGDIDLTGFRKPISHYRETLWNPAAPTYMAVREPDGWRGRIETTAWSMWPTHDHWTFAGWEGKPVAVEVYTRRPRVRISLNGKAKGEFDVSEKTGWKVELSLPYEPGTLVAEALADDGSVAEKCELRTAGAPDHVRFTREKIGRLTWVVAEVVDAAGTVCPYADRDIEFEGDVICTCSGDLADTVPAPSRVRRTWHGRAMAVLRSR